MKMLFTLTLVFFFFIANAQSLHVDKTKTPSNVTFACNFFGNSNSYKPVDAVLVSDATAEKWMNSIVDKITELCGLQNRFLFKALKNYNNCSAICFSNNIGQDRFIQFDRNFLEEYEKTTKNPWFVTGVVAHEIGHHLNGHSLTGTGSRPAEEIEADEFAGFVLQKLGAGLAQSQGVFSFLTETEGPPTHPVKKLRYEAVKRGWDKAAGITSLATLRFNTADDKSFAVNSLLLSRRESNTDKQMELINRALKEVPDFAEALSEKGLIWLKKGNRDSALKYCAKAIVLEPYIALLKLNMAKVQLEKKDVKEAKLFIDDALYFKPVFPAAYQLLASINLSEKNYTDAAFNAEMGLKMNPEDDDERAELFAIAGSSYYNMMKYKDAYNYLKVAKKLDPLNMRVIMLLDQAKQKAGE